MKKIIALALPLLLLVALGLAGCGPNSSIFGKLGLPLTEFDHRRVLAVLTYLRGNA